MTALAWVEKNIELRREKHWQIFQTQNLTISETIF